MKIFYGWRIVAAGCTIQFLLSWLLTQAYGREVWPKPRPRQLRFTEHRRNICPAQCPAALNQRQTVAIGQTREKSRIEFPVV